MKNLSGAAKKNAVKILRKTAAWAILAGCGFALVRCEDRVAGSSVTTGNPTEIQVGFTGENGPVALTGRVEIYGATQIPVPGFRPEPLASFNVAGKQEFMLNAGHLEGIADSLWPMASKDGDSVVRFNLVVTGEQSGAIVRALSYLIKAGEFVLKDGTWKRGLGRIAKVDVAANPLTSYRAFLHPETLNTKKVHFLFLEGTGYYSEADSGTFQFPLLPEGAYNPLYVAIPTKESQATSPQDSVNVHSIDLPLSTAPTEPAMVGAIQSRIPIPDSLKK